MALIPDAALGSLWTGDVPASPVHVDFYDEAGNNVAVHGYDTNVVKLYNAAGTLVATLTGTIHGEHLDVAFGSTTHLATGGVYELRISFGDAGGIIVAAEPFRFVVQSLTGWLTMEQARERWADAPQNDVSLYELLDTARIQCVEYAPAITAGAVISTAYRQAQYLQARAIYMASITNQADAVGVEGFTVRSYPLDWNIRALLRPKKAIGGMF